MGKWIYENSVKWGKIKCVEGGKKVQQFKYRMEKDRLGINKEGRKPQSWVTTG